MVIIAACSSSAHRFSTCFPTGVPSCCTACLLYSVLPSQVCSAASNAMPGIPRRKDTQPVVRGWAIPRCVVPGGTPGADAQGPGRPGWDAGTHPGPGAGLAGRAGWRPQPLRGEAGWTSPHAPCSLHRYAWRAYL